jgi:effector-binding domain-containing protein
MATKEAAMATKEAAMARFAVRNLETQRAAVVRAEVPMNELPEFFGRAFHQVMKAVEDQGLTVTGPPFGFYPKMPGATIEVAAGFPVSAEVRPDGEVAALDLPGGRAIVGVHVGPFETLAQSYQELAEWAASQGLELAGAMWESYLTDPAAEPDPAKWQTLITWPVR